MAKRMYTARVRAYAVQLITFLGFIFGVSVALLTYIASSYFKDVIASDNVSVFYIIIFCVILYALFHMHRFIENVGRAKTLMILFVLQIAVLFFLQQCVVSWWGAILLSLYYILHGVIVVVFDVILEAYSKDTKTGHVRGGYLAAYSLGFLIGPIISLRVLEQYGFHVIFLFAMLLYVAMFCIVFVALNDIVGHVVKKRLSPKYVVARFFANKDLACIYGVSFALHFFYAAMTVYMPIFLRSNGFSWSDIGIMFTIMLVPFVLLDYPAGVLADKKYGEKEMLFGGLVIILISVLCMFVIRDNTFLFWTSILAISRIGAAVVESMVDVYFYKKVSSDDVATINFFRTTRAFAYIISSVMIGGALLIFTQTRYFFVIVGIVMVCGLCATVMLTDTTPARTPAKK